MTDDLLDRDEWKIENGNEKVKIGMRLRDGKSLDLRRGGDWLNDWISPWSAD
jgi:hypothetical protein